MPLQNAAVWTLLLKSNPCSEMYTSILSRVPHGGSIELDFHMLNNFRIKQHILVFILTNDTTKKLLLVKVS